MLPPRTIIQRGGISMTEDEAYKVHIQYIKANRDICMSAMI